MAAGAHYYLWPASQSLDGPDEEPLSARLVCNWATTAGRGGAVLGVLAAELPVAERERGADSLASQWLTAIRQMHTYAQRMHRAYACRDARREG